MKKMKSWHWIVVLAGVAVATFFGTKHLCSETKIVETPAPAATAIPPPACTATPAPAAVVAPVVVPTPIPDPASTLGKPGQAYTTSIYLGVTEWHVYDFGRPFKDKDLGTIILPNRNHGRAFAVGPKHIGDLNDHEDDELPNFVYHVEKPEGFVPVAHPTWKDVNGKHFVVFKKVDD